MSEASKYVAKPEFKKVCDMRLQSYLETFYSSHPLAKKMIEKDFDDIGFHIRATTETILRITLNREINPIAASKLARMDPVACKEWGAYAAEESLHDRLFYKDLRALGLGEDKVYSTKPLFATELLCGYLRHTLDTKGPLTTLAGAYYVESISAMTQPKWLDSIEKRLGKEKVAGAKAHLHLDDSEDHVTEVWNMTMRIVKTKEDEQEMLSELDKINALFIAYFVEVYTVSMEGGDSPSALYLNVAESLAQPKHQ